LLPLLGLVSFYVAGRGFGAAVRAAVVNAMKRPQGYADFALRYMGVVSLALRGLVLAWCGHQSFFSFEMNTMGNPRHSFSRQAKGEAGGGIRFWAAGVCFLVCGGGGGSVVCAGVAGIISFQVTQARRLEKLESDVASGRGLPGWGVCADGAAATGRSLREDFDSAHWAIGDGRGRRRRRYAAARSGHIPGTAAPWSVGNVALAGHRDTFFRGLSRVRLDDVIELETLRGSFKYRVERITVVGRKIFKWCSRRMGSDLGDVLPVSLRGAGSAEVHRAGFAARQP